MAVNGGVYQNHREKDFDPGGVVNERFTIKCGPGRAPVPAWLRYTVRPLGRRRRRLA
jgi:hypothetical protein